MADKVGVFSRLGYAVSGTTVTTAFNFLEGSSLGVSEQFIDTNELRGTRSHSSERVRRGQRRVEGTLLFTPSPLELDIILYAALGGTKSGNTIPLAEDIPLVDWFVDRDGTVYHYTDCAVDTLRLSAQSGGPLQCQLTLVGTDEAQEGTFASVTEDVATQPYVWADGVTTVGGTGYQYDAFDLTVQNNIEVKYRNSLTPTQLVATDRVITVGLPFSLGDASALYGSAVGGVAVVATFTNGAFSLALSMAKVAAPKSPLPFGQRGILDLPWQGVARKDGSTLELVVSNDSTA